MVPITLDQRPDVSVVALDGDVDIQAASELKGILLAALLCRREVQVELAGLTTLDITILQLLWAAQQAADKSGTQVILTGAVPERVKQAMDLASLQKLPVDTQ